jgi:hypothetical protein
MENKMIETTKNMPPMYIHLFGGTTGITDNPSNQRSYNFPIND